MFAAAASIRAMVWRSDEDCFRRAQAVCAAASSLSPTSPPASNAVEGSRQLDNSPPAALAVPPAATAQWTVTQPRMRASMIRSMMSSRVFLRTVIMPTRGPGANPPMAAVAGGTDDRGFAQGQA
jgi:hypothetical protein